MFKVKQEKSVLLKLVPELPLGREEMISLPKDES